MKPARILLPLSTFLLRLGVLFFIYVYFFQKVLDFQVDQFSFYLASIFIIFGVLFFIGSFLKNQTLTVLSSLILFLLSLYKIFSFSGSLTSSSFVAYLFFGMVVFYFLCKGNRN